MDEFYNQITYDKKWNTEANIKKVNKLLKKYRTPFWSDCPPSWVDEVSELLSKIDKKYGIARNDSGIINGIAVDTKQAKEFFQKNKNYNQKHNPKIKLDQFKEKYGTLRVYFNCDDDEIRNDVEKMIDDCQVQIIKKLKYPIPILKCVKCGHEGIWYLKDKKNRKICRFCNSLVKNIKKTVI